LRVDVDFDQGILNCCAASLARAVAERCLVRCELLQFVITEEKLNIFRRYAGDVDGWVLARDAKEHEVMADSDWVEIEELRHRLWLEQHQPVSEDFIAETRKLISERVPDESAVQVLRRLI
jgi:hypothetical protein